MGNLISCCNEKDKDLSSDVIKSHQNASLGNGIVEKYIDMYFPKPKDFNSFVMISQIMAGEAIKAAVTSRVLSASFSGSCQTVIACKSTTQKKHSYSFCKETKFFIAPK